MLEVKIQLNMIYVGEASGKKYYISRNDGSDQNDTGRESYSTASTAAENFGGYLAVFETQAEQTRCCRSVKSCRLRWQIIGLDTNTIICQRNWEWVNGWTGGGGTMYTDQVRI